MTTLLAPDSQLHTAPLWDQFAAPLRSFLAKRAPREVDVEDLLQDVFLRIQAQLPTLRDAQRVDAWIFQIARNVVADSFRKRSRREQLTQRDGGVDPAVSAGEDEQPSAEGELITCLASLIAQLPQPYRHAIELTELRGVTQVEAAGLLGLSISGMKSRVQRGREHLKRVIHGACVVETDVRGRVIGCDPREDAICGEALRPSPDSRDSIHMTNANPHITETETSNQGADAGDAGASTGCCGGPAPQGADACCALDATVKASGGSGCGCGPKTDEAGPERAAAKKGCC